MFSIRNALNIPDASLESRTNDVVLAIGAVGQAGAWALDAAVQAVAGVVAGGLVRTCIRATASGAAASRAAQQAAHAFELAAIGATVRGLAHADQLSRAARAMHERIGNTAGHASASVLEVEAWARFIAYHAAFGEHAPPVEPDAGPAAAWLRFARPNVRHYAAAVVLALEEALRRS